MNYEKGDNERYQVLYFLGVEINFEVYVNCETHIIISEISTTCTLTGDKLLVYLDGEEDKWEKVITP